MHIPIRLISKTTILHTLEFAQIFSLPLWENIINVNHVIVLPPL